MQHRQNWNIQHIWFIKYSESDTMHCYVSQQTIQLCSSAEIGDMANEHGIHLDHNCAHLIINYAAHAICLHASSRAARRNCTHALLSTAITFDGHTGSNLCCAYLFCAHPALESHHNLIPPHRCLHAITPQPPNTAVTTLCDRPRVHHPVT